jgi:hypothetical protein
MTVLNLVNLNLVNLKNMIEDVGVDITNEDVDYADLLGELSVKGRGYCEAVLQFVQGVIEYRRGLAKAKEARDTLRHLDGRIGGNTTAGGTFREKSVVPIAVGKLPTVARATVTRAMATAATSFDFGKLRAPCKRVLEMLQASDRPPATVTAAMAATRDYRRGVACLTLLEKAGMVQPIKGRGPGRAVYWKANPAARIDGPSHAPNEHIPLDVLKATLLEQVRGANGWASPSLLKKNTGLSYPILKKGLKALVADDTVKTVMKAYNPAHTDPRVAPTLRTYWVLA